MDIRKDTTGRFLEARNSLIKNRLKVGDGRTFTKRYTRLMDDYICDIFRGICSKKDIKEIEEDRFALFALGSYGRRELCLGSDVDLLIVFRGALSQKTRQVISTMLYPLWDAKLDVGQSVLTVQECNHLALQDFRFFTSTIDARFLLGSRPFSQLFNEAFWLKIHHEKDFFLKQLLVYLQRRNDKYQGQSYFVEPDIKEGLGGLRDILFIEWLSRIYLSIKELNDIRRFEEFYHFETDKLNRSKNFLLKVRNYLHLLTGRKEDRLLIPFQMRLSKELGFEDTGNITGSERFMRTYYKHMNRIQWSNEEFLAKILDVIDPIPVDFHIEKLSDEFQIVKNNLVLKKGHSMKNDPLKILRAFNKANKRGLFLGSGFIWEARRIINSEGKKLSSLPGAGKLFLNIIFNPSNQKILRLALEIGLIDLFIPEFRKIRNKALFSVYHTSTVDIHSLKTMEVLNDFSKGSSNLRWPIFHEVFKELVNPENIYLAALLHDIGKGYRGDHCEKGSALITRILSRLGVDGDAVRLLRFLVKNHLLLADVYKRRDLSEEKTSIRTAQRIGDIETLNHLFLLTAADSMATGPMASSDWNITLLIEIFLKVKKLLQKGTLVSPDNTKKVEKNKSKLFKRLAERYDENKIKELMEQVSARYMISTPHETMYQHFQLALDPEKDVLSWKLNKMQEAPVTEVILCIIDQPGLFSKMVGVFTMNNINVLSARISTLKNGRSFDVYNVTNPVDPFHEEEQWKKIKEDLIMSLDDRMSLDEMILKKYRKVLDEIDAFHEHRTSVRVDNSGSDFFTIIEVNGRERLGLLYHLAKKLYELHLDIRFAKVDSDKEKMSGVFYVRDINGQKIYENPIIENIKEELGTII
ncbi:MAG: [protein-PII] uridylyltransferase [Deltaproteobacteria bacterium]|nr:[protein-PII] uridylyltransferase [Deltaproteobacteria bacterium]